MLGGDPADAFATAAPGVRIWAKGRAAEHALEASAAHVVAASAALATLAAQAAPAGALREATRDDAARAAPGLPPRARRARTSAAANRRWALGAALELYEALPPAARRRSPREIGRALWPGCNAVTPPDRDALAYARSARSPRTGPSRRSTARWARTRAGWRARGRRRRAAPVLLLRRYPATRNGGDARERRAGAAGPRAARRRARAALETLFAVRAPAAALLAAATAHAAKLPESHADRACAAVCFAVADAEGAAWAPFCAEVVARAPPHGDARAAGWRLAETLLKRPEAAGEAVREPAARALEGLPAAGPRARRARRSASRRRARRPSPSRRWPRAAPRPRPCSRRSV